MIKVTAVRHIRRPARIQTSTRSTLYGDFVPNKVKWGRCSVVVSWKRVYHVIHADVVKKEISRVVQYEREVRFDGKNVKLAKRKTLHFLY